MYLEVVNPLFGLTKGSVPTAMIQVKTIFIGGMNFYVGFPGVGKKPFPLGADWQRGKNADSAFRLLSFHDLLQY